MVHFVAMEITVVTVITGTTLILVYQVINTSKINFMLETTVFMRHLVRTCYSVWMTVWYAGAYAPAYQTVIHTE